MKKLFTAVIALSVMCGCTKAQMEATADDGNDVRLNFTSDAQLSVDYIAATRATAGTFNGVIGIINSEHKWEKAPSSITFAGLTGNATTSQTIITTPSTVAVPIGPYTFVSSAVSGNGTLVIAGDTLVTLAGGAQTSDNDIVWATQTTSVVKPTSGSSYGIHFAYTHAFSAVRFELTSGGSIDDNTLMSESTLTGVGNMGAKKNAKLDIRTGAVSDIAATLGDGEQIAWKTNYLVLPTTTSAAAIAIAYHGVTYRGTLHSLTLQAGRRTLVKITLNSTDLTFDATVADWTEITDDSLVLQ